MTTESNYVAAVRVKTQLLARVRTATARVLRRLARIRHTDQSLTRRTLRNWRAQMYSNAPE